MLEKWKPVVGFEGIYEVSNHGRVKTLKTGRIKKPTCHVKDPRFFVLLWRENKCKAIRIHRLVLLAFKGAPPAGHEGCHNDGNTSNNHISNLRWDTAANNQADRAKHGTSNRGEQCATAKITEAQALAIRADTRPQSEIAADYGVNQPQISRIKNRIRWAHI